MAKDNISSKMSIKFVENDNSLSLFEDHTNRQKLSENNTKILNKTALTEAKNINKDDWKNLNSCSNDSDFIKYPLSEDLIDEPDNVQGRIYSAEEKRYLDLTINSNYNLRNENDINHDIYFNGIDTVLSTPSQSTLSSPNSTPTKYIPHFQANHAHCCKHDCLVKGRCDSSVSSVHKHSDRLNDIKPLSLNGCKQILKYEGRLGPSPYRQLLPIALCILSFATVFSVLIVYMDTTEIRHQQFRLNMSRDYELYGIAQDDPTLIAFLREIHMRKYPMHFLKNGDEYLLKERINISDNNDVIALQMMHYIIELLGGKMTGSVIQSLTGNLGKLIIAPSLSENLDWDGIIIEPEPQRYFTLRKQNAFRPRMQIVHACVSNNANPKEITIHNEEPDVQINSILDDETSWFNSRVKCFPLYTIMLACERTTFDLLSLGVHGNELEILSTLPFDKIRVEIISIHLADDRYKKREYIECITKFLEGKNYKLQKSIGSNYFYQRNNLTSRIRKKDTHLLKTP